VKRGIEFEARFDLVTLSLKREAIRRLAGVVTEKMSRVYNWNMMQVTET